MAVAKASVSSGDIPMPDAAAIVYERGEQEVIWMVRNTVDLQYTRRDTGCDHDDDAWLAANCLFRLPLAVVWGLSACR